MLTSVLCPNLDAVSLKGTYRIQKERKKEKKKFERSQWESTAFI